MHLKRARSSAIAIAVASVSAVAVAACGSSAMTGSNTSASSAAATASTSRTKLAACLKQHGVTLPSRPAGGRRPPGGTPPGGGYSGGGTPPAGGYGGGGGLPGGGGTGGAGGPGMANGAQSSKFRAAFKACGANFGGGQFSHGGGTGGAKPSAAALAKFTACVDAHGYKLPKANTSGNGPIFPKSIESNQKFEAAAKACQSDLRPSGRPSSGGSSGSAD
jgi:hypothetical protein